MTESVGEMFQAIGEKPKFEAKRLGTVKEGQSRPRPVKVVFRSGAVTRTVLSKAPKL